MESKELKYIRAQEIHKTWNSYNLIWKTANYELKGNNISKYYLRFMELIGEEEALCVNKLFQKLKNETISIELIIEFINVKLITPVFVSNIFLLSKLPIEIKIITPYDESSTYQLIQYFGNDFFKDKHSEKKVEIFKKAKESDNYYLQTPTSVISQSYFPSIYLTEKSFKEYCFNIYKFRKNKENANAQVQKYNENKLTKHEIYNLFCELILNDIGVLSEHLSNEETYTSITNKEIYFYQSLLKKGFIKLLSNKSLLHIMLLRLILKNSFQWKHSKKNNNEIFVVGLERNTLRKTTKEFTDKSKTDKEKKDQRKQIDKFIDFLINLNEYIESIFPGIYEISKNVIEHSSNNSGALSIRIFRKEDIQKIKNIKEQTWTEYFNKPIFKSINHFLDISIVDNGEHGIFDTLYSNIESSLNFDKYIKESNRELIDNDLRKLTEIVKRTDIDLGKELFQRLFQLSTQNQIDRPFTFQLKKASAGYGLIIFASNIFENKGCYLVKTHSHQQNITFGFFKGIAKKILIIRNKNELIGTHYNFILPINPKKRSTTQLIRELEPKGIADDDIFKSLKNIKFKESKSPFINLPYGISYIIDKIQIGNNKELSVFTFKETNENIDRSELLRFLADINLSTQNKSHIIVKNLNHTVLVGLVDLLKILYKYFHKNFWSDPQENSQSILFYCKNNETNLFSTFLLCGKTVSALLAVNRKLSYYQLVDVPIEIQLEAIKKIEQDKTNYTNEVLSIFKTPFFINEHPIFFDMVIKATKYHTLFEANVHEFLTKEII